MVLTDTPVKQMLEVEQRVAKERRLSRDNAKAKAKKTRGKSRTKKSRLKGTCVFGALNFVLCINHSLV